METFNSVVKPAFDDLEKEEWFEENSEKIDQLVSYLKRIWIGRVDRAPSFAIQSWNKYNQVLEDVCITNNVVESFNATWTYSLSRRPSLYEVIEGFKRKEAMSQTILREEFLVFGTNRTEQEKNRVTQRNARRQELKQLCSGYGEIERKEYMKFLLPFLSSS